MSDSVFSDLVGKKIVSVYSDDDAFVLVFKTKEDLWFAYEAEGDCCALAYFEDLSGFGNFKDEVITKIEDLDWHYYDEAKDLYLDTTFYKIYTRWGVAAELSLRISHNGYYGGWINKLKEIPSKDKLKLLWKDESL